MPHTTFVEKLASIRGYAPGIALAVIIACAAMYLEKLGLGPSLVIGLVIGIATRSLLGPDAIPKQGIDFTGKHVLAVGVALLGIRISAQNIMAMGFQPALLVVAAMVLTITASCGVARLLGLGLRVGLLGGVGTAVCGASAAMATASVLRRDEDLERDTSLIVLTVVALSAVAMIFYPLLALALGLSGTEAGIVMGGSIHNVPQAVAAGFTVSNEAGDVATLTKLFRVSLLAPILMVMSLLLASSGDYSGGKGKASVPWFVIAFALLAIVASVIEVPQAVRQLVLETSNWLLLIAITAIGMSTPVAHLRNVGPKVLVLVGINSVVLLGLLLAGVAFGLI